METKFKTLRIISVVFKVIAWIVAAFTIIGFLVLLIGGTALSQFGGRYGAPSVFGPLWGVGMAFYVLLLGGIWFVSLLAGAELILVIIAIEENTRALKPQV